MWANFFDPAGISIGEDTIIGDHAFLDGRAPLLIGAHTDIASSVMVYNSEHDLENEDFGARTEPVQIGDYVLCRSPCHNFTWSKNRKRGCNAAGAVVTKRCSRFHIVGGVPAKVIGERKNKDLHYKIRPCQTFPIKMKLFFSLTRKRPKDN